jgi:hypothetical protein
MPGNKKSTGGVMDSVARRLRIGGLEGNDGNYVATSDLNPKDRNRVEKLAQARRPLTSPSRPLREVAEAIIGRKAADVQKEINNIYAASGRRSAMPSPAESAASGNRMSAMNAAEMRAMRRSAMPSPAESAASGNRMSAMNAAEMRMINEGPMSPVDMTMMRMYGKKGKKK